MSIHMRDIGVYYAQASISPRYHCSPALPTRALCPGSTGRPRPLLFTAEQPPLGGPEGDSASVCKRRALRRQLDFDCRMRIAQI